MDYAVKALEDAPMSLEFSVDMSGFEDLKGSILENIGPKGQEKILDIAAEKVRKELIDKTPTSPSGDHPVRRAWMPPRKLEGAREVYNVSPVMQFLEEGTQAHGPVAGPFLWFKNQSGQLIRTKWVRGITAMHIVRDFMPRAAEILVETMQMAMDRVCNRG
jgi:hypothetical protein